MFEKSLSGSDDRIAITECVSTSCKLCIIEDERKHKKVVRNHSLCGPPHVHPGRWRVWPLCD